MAKNKTTRGAKNNWRHVDGGRAFVIPYTCLRHDNFKRMSARAVKIVLDLGRQYSGLNNGYLCAAWVLMRDEGWKSKETVDLAVAEAVHYSMLERTQHGGKHRPNLYAFTWWPIDKDPERPLDVGPTLVPSNAWKETRESFQVPENILASRKSRLEKFEKKREEEQKNNLLGRSTGHRSPDKDVQRPRVGRSTSDKSTITPFNVRIKHK